MSDATRRRLDDALAALDLALDATQRDALLAYVDLLARWNAVYNLTAVRDRDAMLTQHLADCLAAVGPVHRRLGGTTARLLDVGSGGGLPGAVLAITLPTVQVTCIDAVGKKAAFVRQVAAELRLGNLHVQHARVESLITPAFDLIVSRAFASLGDFVRLSEAALAPRGAWVAMKARPPVSEWEALPGHIEVFHVEPLHVPGLDAERCLVWLRRRGDETARSPFL